MSVYCRAEIPYVAGPDGERTGVETPIRDGRTAKLTWQKHGFELRSMPSKVDRWDDEDQIVERHYPEMTEMAMEETGCDAVIFYPAIVRGPEQQAAGLADRAPIETAHSDYTERYQAMMRTPGHPYISILKPSMTAAKVTSADLANASRILTLQMWRNIGDPRPDRPIAFCDATTVGREELTSYLVEEYGGLPTQFESFLLLPPGEGTKKRRWFTFPEMTADEVVLFRAYDSERAQSGEPFWTPHTAFVDPTVDDDAPRRASVETRAICIFT